MRQNISNTQINKVLKDILKENNKIEEGWFSNLFGSNESTYANKLEEIMQNLISNVYYDQDLIDEIRDLYDDIQNSNIDRRSKKELLDTMYGVYQTLEVSKRRLDSYIYKLRRLK